MTAFVLSVAFWSILLAAGLHPKKGDLIHSRLSLPSSSGPSPPTHLSPSTTVKMSRSTETAVLLEELLKPGHGGMQQMARLLNFIGWGGPRTKEPSAIRIGVLGASQVRALGPSAPVYGPLPSLLTQQCIVALPARSSNNKSTAQRRKHPLVTPHICQNTLPLPLRSLAAGGHLCPHLARQAALRRDGGSRGSAGRRQGSQVCKAARVSALLRVCAAGAAWQAARKAGGSTPVNGSRQPAPLRRHLQLHAPS